MSKTAKANRARDRRRERRTMGNLHLESKDSLTAGSLIDGARMYAASADAVSAMYPACIFPISQLLCTSIELSLKAFLRYKDADEDRLVKLGHDLPALLKEAVAVGLLDTDSRLYVLTVVGQNYAEKTFVYPEQGLMRSTATWRLRAMCHELLVEAFTAINGAPLFEAMNKAPGLCVQGTYPTDPSETAPSGWSGLAESVVLREIERVLDATAPEGGDNASALFRLKAWAWLRRRGRLRQNLEVFRLRERLGETTANVGRNAPRGASHRDAVPEDGHMRQIFALTVIAFALLALRFVLRWRRAGEGKKP